MADYRNYNQNRTEKRCHVCKDMLPLDRFRVRSKPNGSFIGNECRVCEGVQVSRYRRETKEGAVAEIMRRKKYLCNKNGIPFDLSKDWIRNTLEAQEWKCLLTGIPFNWYKSSEDVGRGYAWDSISMDRIDPTQGYVKSNVRFILNAVNLFKNDGDDDRMYTLAEALLVRRNVQSIT